MYNVKTHQVRHHRRQGNSSLFLSLLLNSLSLEPLEPFEASGQLNLFLDLGRDLDPPPLPRRYRSHHRHHHRYCHYGLRVLL